MKPVGRHCPNLSQSRMGQDRANLLRALAIDRGEARPVPARRAWPGRLLLGLAGVVTLLAGAWVFLPHGGVGGRAAEPVAAPAEVVRSTEKSPASAHPAPPANAGLTASGYVVARRKATEIGRASCRGRVQR